MAICFVPFSIYSSHLSVRKITLGIRSHSQYISRKLTYMLYFLSRQFGEDGCANFARELLNIDNNACTSEAITSSALPIWSCNSASFMPSSRSSGFPDFQRPSHLLTVAGKVENCRHYYIRITATGIAPDLHRLPY